LRNLRLQLLSLATLPIYGGSVATAADPNWDGGTTIATPGDGVSTFVAGTWSTSIANWDPGNGLAHVVWDNTSPIDSAIFAGTVTNGTKTVAIGSNITVNQIKINAGSTGPTANRYDIGGSATQNDFPITFGGSYSDATAAISSDVVNTFHNNNFAATITGSIIGGLVIKHGSNITTPAASGRFALTNTNSNYVGDVVMLAGNLASGSTLGAAGNKLVLKGGAIFLGAGGAVTSTFSRNIDVAAASGFCTNAVSGGLQTLELTGIMTGSADLTRYAATQGTASSELRLSGDMALYTGLSGVGYTVDELSSAPDLITVTIPQDGEPKKFARLLADATEDP
jgi:hypothetical protein